MTAGTFDALIVGSGVSGGWAAKELTERGLKVLLIERGRQVTHGVDYTHEHTPPWELPFRGLGDRRLYESEYDVQRRGRSFEEGSVHFFVNDKEHPYQSEPGTSFTWLRGYQLGGRSLTWGRASFRYSELNFSEHERDSRGIRWPIGYADLQPWYSHVERFIGVSGSRDGLEVLPDGEFLPPFGFNCLEEHVSGRIAAQFPGRRMIHERTAVLSVDHNGRAKCHLCGPCHRGCSTGSYFSSQSSTLPAAQATGNLTTLTDSIVAGVDYDPVTGRATAVRTIDTKTRERRTYSARVIFLNASTLGTTHILLNSRSESFPQGLANRSGALGHYLMDTVKGPTIVAEFDRFHDHAPIGNRPSGIYIPRFQNVARQDAPFLRGYGYQGRAYRTTWPRGFELAEVGTALKQSLRQQGPWMMMLGAMGECLPYHDNRVTLDERQRDRWNLPQLKVKFHWQDNERAMAAHMADEGLAMLKAAGAVKVTATRELAPGGNANHEMGTARMGADPRTSVLNAFNQAHDVPNLFVTDGACMPSSPCQNPSLTYMALTARACEYAVTQLRAGKL